MAAAKAGGTLRLPLAPTSASQDFDRRLPAGGLLIACEWEHGFRWRNDPMGFDELEWVREVIDQWLSTNGSLIGIVVALLLALGSLLVAR